MVRWFATETPSGAEWEYCHLLPINVAMWSAYIINTMGIILRKKIINRIIF